MEFLLWEHLFSVRPELHNLIPLAMKKKSNCSYSGSFEDFVFEKRNKAYGAYDLNKHRNRFMLIGFIISVTASFTAVAIPFIQNRNNPQAEPVITITKKVEVKKVDNEIKLPDIPLPEKSTIPDVAYKAPNVVEDADPSLNPLLPTDIYQNIVDNKPVDTNIAATGVSTLPEIQEPQTDFIISPQEFATFGKGGIEEFRTWVSNNMHYPKQALDNGIFGKVYVEFCIDRTGNVVDITIIRGLDSSINEEVKKILQSSPRWTPAKNGGEPVKQKFSMPLLFNAETNG